MRRAPQARMMIIVREGLGPDEPVIVDCVATPADRQTETL